MPLLPPVITATLPSNFLVLMISSILLEFSGRADHVSLKPFFLPSTLR